MVFVFRMPIVFLMWQTKARTIAHTEKGNIEMNRPRKNIRKKTRIAIWMTDHEYIVWRAKNFILHFTEFYIYSNNKEKPSKLFRLLSSLKKVKYLILLYGLGFWLFRFFFVCVWVYLIPFYHFRKKRVLRQR